MNIEITVEVTALDGKSAFFSLSVDDARKLYAELHELFGNREVEKPVTVPYYGQPATPFPGPAYCSPTHGDPVPSLITISGGGTTTATTLPSSISTETHPGAFGSSLSYTQ